MKWKRGYNKIRYKKKLEIAAREKDPVLCFLIKVAARQWWDQVDLMKVLPSINPPSINPTSRFLNKLTVNLERTWKADNLARRLREKEFGD